PRFRHITAFKLLAFNRAFSLDPVQRLKLRITNMDLARAKLDVATPHNIDSILVRRLCPDSNTQVEYQPENKAYGTVGSTPVKHHRTVFLKFVLDNWLVRFRSDVSIRSDFFMSIVCHSS